MSHVFISYSRNDASFAKLLSQQLNKAGYTTWVDKENIRAGRLWADEIENAIRGCDAFVVVASKEAVSSSWVRREIEYANREQKRIFPVLVGDAVELPPLLQRYQAINLHSGHERKAVIELKAALSEISREENVSLDDMLAIYDIETLFILDRLYVAFSSLTDLLDPRPDYMGIQNQKVLYELIDRTLNELPHSVQETSHDEVSTLKQLIASKQYKELTLRNGLS